jgi:hypothetical protein
VWGAAGEELLLMFQDRVDVFLNLVGGFQVGGPFCLLDSVRLRGLFVGCWVGVRAGLGGAWMHTNGSASGYAFISPVPNGEGPGAPIMGGRSSETVATRRGDFCGG